MKTLNILTAAALILITGSAFANPDTTATDSVKISESASFNSIELPAFEWGYAEEVITDEALQNNYSEEIIPTAEATFIVEMPEFIWGDPNTCLDERCMTSIDEQVITFGLPESVWGYAGSEPPIDSDTIDLH